MVVRGPGWLLGVGRMAVGEPALLLEPGRMLVRGSRLLLGGGRMAVGEPGLLLEWQNGCQRA